MEQYRKLEIPNFKDFDKSQIPDELGERPEVEWLRVKDLVIDTTYQREIGSRGKNNILSIARNFNWAKFGIVIVAAVGPGVYAIVDGQHRATVCLLLGIERIPCLVIFADSAEQAAAFADINGKVTAMTPLQIHAARLAAGDEKAIAVRDACAKAGVTICRYPVQASNLKVGETLAVGSMYKLLDQHGVDVFILALKCITKSGDGNPGQVRSNIVRGLCYVLDAEPFFKKHPKDLISAFDEFDFETAMERARIEARSRRVSMNATFASTIFRHLEKHMKVAA